MPDADIIYLSGITLAIRIARVMPDRYMMSASGMDIASAANSRRAADSDRQ